VQAAPAVVDQHGQEAGEQRNDRQGQAEHPHDGAADAGRLALGGAHAQIHHSHTGRLADGAPEGDEVRAHRARPGDRRQDPRDRAQVDAADERGHQSEDRPAGEHDGLHDRHVDGQRDGAGRDASIGRARIAHVA
jgi:hypothetical protein